MLNSKPLPEESRTAARELLRRRMARGNLIAFTEYTFERYRAAPHHHLIADKLEAVARGEIKRLMIFMPPRNGKSELASVRFPAWYIGRTPSRQIIACSYAQELALCQRYYCKTFPYAKAPGDNAGLDGALAATGGDTAGLTHFHWRTPAEMIKAAKLRGSGFDEEGNPIW